jgi:REP element-mobilizing transposase RayT
MERYPVVDDLLRPILRVAMPRAARLDAPGGTGHVVARCKNREFCCTTLEDFELLLAHLREMRRTSEVTLDAYTLMANHTATCASRRPRWTPLGGPCAGS